MALDAAEILSRTTDQAGGAVIDLGAGDMLVLAGVVRADLSAGDFVFLL